jgi:hypothetical protein
LDTHFGLQVAGVLEGGEVVGLEMSFGCGDDEVPDKIFVLWIGTPDVRWGGDIPK